MSLCIPIFLFFHSSRSDIVFAPVNETNFDLRFGQNGTISTTFANSGYSTLVRVGSSSVTLLNLQSKSCSGVLISTHLTQLSANAVLIAFKFVNSNSTSQTVNLSVSSNVSLDNNGDAPFETVEGKGFATWSGLYNFTIICMNYSLVSSVTTYWYGRFANLNSSYWIRAPNSSYSGGDSAMAFSWQGISISQGGSKTVAVIMKSGVFDGDSPVLIMDRDTIPARCLLDEVLYVNGSVTNANGSVTVIVVINGDCSQIYWLDLVWEPGSLFNATISPGDYGLSNGIVQLTFYAVDNSGRVSSGVNFSTIIMPYRSRSPIASDTHSPRPTVSVYQSPSPSAAVTSIISSGEPIKNNTSSAALMIGGIVGGVVVLAIVVCVCAVKAIRKRRTSEQDDMTEVARSEKRLSLVEWSDAVTGKSLMTSEKIVA
jgi:hypothetical protein